MPVWPLALRPTWASSFAMRLLEAIRLKFSGRLQRGWLQASKPRLARRGFGCRESSGCGPRCASATNAYHVVIDRVSIPGLSSALRPHSSRTATIRQQSSGESARQPDQPRQYTCPRPPAPNCAAGYGARITGRMGVPLGRVVATGGNYQDYAADLPSPFPATNPAVRGPDPASVLPDGALVYRSWHARRDG